MQHVGGDLVGGFEHEAADRHAWMRQHQRVSLHHQRVVEQQIDVDGAGTPALAALSPQLLLDIPRGRQQCLGGHVRVDPQHGIEKRGLAGGPAYRCRGVVTAAGHTDDLRPAAQTVARLIELRCGLTQIRPQTDQAMGHRRRHDRSADAPAVKTKRRHGRESSRPGPPHASSARSMREMQSTNEARS